MERQKNAIYPLSADPVHNGHVSTVKYAVESGIFNRIYVEVGVNPFKKTLFDTRERIELIKKAITAEGLSDKVSVGSYDGLLRNYAKINGIDFIVRGYRNGKDAEYEAELADFNGEYGLKTWVVPATGGNTNVSSSLVKAVVSEFGFVHEYVHPAVKQALEEKMRGVSLIGVTGNMGAGKSTFCKNFVEYTEAKGKIKASHVDFDRLVHTLYFGDSALSYNVRAQIKESFGEEVFEAESLNRKKLAGIVFGSKNNRDELARIVKVPATIMLEEELRKRKGIVLVDAAYFTEYGMLPLVNCNIIFVSCSEEERIKRIFDRDKITPEEARAKITAQHDPETKRKMIQEAQKKAGHGFFYEVQSGKDQGFGELEARIEEFFPMFGETGK